MKPIVFFSLITVLLIFSCRQKPSLINNVEEQFPDDTERIFSASSFWNTPIPEDPEIDPSSNHFIELLKKEPTGARIGININKFTIPVYEVDSTTPVYRIGKVFLTEEEKRQWKVDHPSFGHGKEFDAEPVPIPDYALPDPYSDAHMVLIDRQRRIIWDMWGAEKKADGQWVSKTGMRYNLDGEGVFDREKLGIKDGESVHFYGPGRAAGVPVIAGLIMYDEVIRGEIRHKLAIATRFNAFRDYVYPATGTDGFTPGGIPEGAVIQLDPTLDLSKFDLLPGELVVAKALQKYGAVVVDIAGGTVLYAEQLKYQAGKSWEGKLRDYQGGINTIPLDYFRVLKLENIQHNGDVHNYYNNSLGQ
ncbi:MAG: hypothetical protein GYA22_02670 [Bacteroidales bacterium]|nr:hypothetical protein [Bacteroidales bacterium]